MRAKQARRLRFYTLTTLLLIALTLYLTSGSRQTRSSDFYLKTTEALQSREYVQAAKERDAESVGSRLKAAEEAAKRSAEDKGQKYIESVEGEKSVAGRVKVGGDEKEKKLKGVAHLGGRLGRDQDVLGEGEEEEDREVEAELNGILKRSPIIIFSKTYCPHSKRAKHILLDLYKILPEPYVVELDEHPLGARLQHTLGATTHRKTVPNVLLMGRSIGGGDDIQELHDQGTLVDTVRALGGSRIVEVGLREEEGVRTEVRRRRRV